VEALLPLEALLHLRLLSQLALAQWHQALRLLLVELLLVGLLLVELLLEAVELALQ